MPPRTDPRHRWRLGVAVLLALILLPGILVLTTGHSTPHGLPLNSGDGKNDNKASPSRELTERLKACVFPVHARNPDENDLKRVRVELGSCIAVGEKGTFLTAAHVVRGDPKTTRVVVLVGEKELPATVIRSEGGCDAAVLSVPDYDGAVLDLADAPPKRETPVFVAGFPVKFSGAAIPRLIITSGRIDELAVPSPLKELHKGDVIRIVGVSDVGGSGGAVVDPSGSLLGVVYTVRFVGNEVTHIHAIAASDLKPLVSEKR
ncbi:MAG: serine protease [Gemmataceae bacterium]